MRMFLWFLRMEQRMAERFGYRFTVHFEDFLLAAGCISLGMMLMAVFSGSALSKIRTIRQRRLDRIKLMDIHKGKKREYIVNADSIAEFTETLLIIILKPLGTIKRYTLKDEKRTRKLMIIFLAIGFILIFLAFLSVCTVFEDGINYYK